MKIFALARWEKILNTRRKIDVVLTDDEDKVLGRNAVELVVGIDGLEHIRKAGVRYLLPLKGIFHHRPVGAGGLVQREAAVGQELVLLVAEKPAVGADDVAVLVGLHAVPLRLMLGALVVGVLPAQALLVQLRSARLSQTFITFPVVGRAALRTDDDVVALLERLAADRTANALIIHYIQPFQ